ncbi:hypothetical protein EXU57_20940 [Segetibacter sp. 3557_3]|uniref:metallophosphoesterase family protein n=1 Tax=Segetibacter sp. 3557_3 TaxID=2547429 RepID=UPI001058466A|nr:metallophosphoesterase [Segetibacter sp. 3557_3]TDH20861.1 hypothetical protein EXU57_20940 [Segetibacter sp. 3557_3]
MDTTPARRSLRIAHITDCHVYPNPTVVAAIEGIFQRLMQADDRAELILNTGDSILDANFETLQQVMAQWQVWTGLVSGLDIPMYSALGNHDIWIPSLLTLPRQLGNPMTGSRMALNMLKMERDYYSFSKNGWKFICLNSMKGRYSLGKKQLRWLETELEGCNEPVCIYSHVPVLSIASFMYHLKKKRLSPFPVREMHRDTFILQALFRRYPVVKLCLAGHVHYIDDITYGGVRYLCQGAVCGNWWKAPLDECPAAYAIIDLFEDGSIEKQVVYY